MSTEPPPPGTAGPPAGPQVGADEWVARQAHRREYLPSWLGGAQRAGERIGWWAWLAIAALAAALLPLLGLGGFQLQVGIDTLVLALLALGLNVVVGWTGLLDLGYVAFFGAGAYLFALLSSNQLGPHGIHLPAYLSLPIVMVGTALLGLLVGLPSRRLIGDYLAIVTLFFGEAFVEFTNNVAPSKLGGPDGIIGIDTINAFGHQITSNEGYFYLLLIVVVLTMAAMRLLENSRTGRGWRAVREDPLAAASMTVPIVWVKLMAFAVGAAIAGLAGSIFAAQQISVFPTDFDTPYLILVYAALILGGAGSIGGAVVGALVLNVTLDGVLRNPTDAGYVFYGLILVTLLVKMRPWRKLVGRPGRARGVRVRRARHRRGHLVRRGGRRPAFGWLDRRRAARVGDRPGQCADRGKLRLRPAGVRAGRAGPAEGPVADHPAGANHLPGLVRVGNPAGHRARDHPAADDRRDPDRDDECPPAGPARGPASRGPDMSAAPEHPGGGNPARAARPGRGRPAGRARSQP